MSQPMHHSGFIKKVDYDLKVEVCVAGTKAVLTTKTVKVSRYRLKLLIRILDKLIRELKLEEKKGEEQ